MCQEIAYSDYEKMNALLGHGANSIPSDLQDWMPIHLAAKQGDSHAVRLLLDQGADIQTLTGDFMSALDIAGAEGQHQAFAVLREHSIKSTKTPQGHVMAYLQNSMVEQDSQVKLKDFEDIIDFVRKLRRRGILKYIIPLGMPFVGNRLRRPSRFSLQQSAPPALTASRSFPGLSPGPAATCQQRPLPGA